jgi:transketolase
MPCTNVFDRQDAEYKREPCCRRLPRASPSKPRTDGWRKYVGLHGAVIGIDRFGESAPAGQLFDISASPRTGSPSPTSSTAPDGQGTATPVLIF